MIGRFAIVIAAFIVISAFFLPWMHGSNEFADRTFSGFDFARLVRNFEITASSPPGLGQVRATAIALYLVPALAVNALVFHFLAFTNRGWIGATRVASASCAAYSILLLSGLLVLSAVPVTGLAPVIGWPAYGLAATAIGSLVLGGVDIVTFLSRACGLVKTQAAGNRDAAGGRTAER
jgi:hypothetical protein